MNKDVDNLKVVKILDPTYCVRCSHAYIADVLLTDGNRKKMFYCARRDCDNWSTEQVSSASEARITDTEESILTPEDGFADRWDL